MVRKNIQINNIMSLIYENYCKFKKGTEIKPYIKCITCKIKIFGQGKMGEMRDHIVMNHPDKCFKCRFCDELFILRNYIWVHESKCIYNKDRKYYNHIYNRKKISYEEHKLILDEYEQKKKDKQINDQYFNDYLLHSGRI